MDKQRTAICIGSGAGMLGTFLPWFSLGAISIDGTQGDGWITFFMFGVSLLFGLLGEKTEPPKVAARILSSLVSALCVFTVYYDIQHAKEKMAGNMFGFGLQVGPGIYLIMGAGIMVILCSLLMKPEEAKK